MGAYGWLWVPMGIFGCFWVSMRVYGYIWVSRGFCGFMGILDVMGVYRYLWVSWVFMGIGEPLWMSMGISECLWMSWVFMSVLIIALNSEVVLQLTYGSGQYDSLYILTSFRPQTYSIFILPFLDGYSRKIYQCSDFMSFWIFRNIYVLILIEVRYDYFNYNFVWKLTNIQECLIFNWVKIYGRVLILQWLDFWNIYPLLFFR